MRGRKAKKPSFRFCAKKVGLTYSCPVDFSDNPIPGNCELRDFLTDKIGKCLYIVAEEKHENGKRHYHVWVHADLVIDTCNPKFFDYPNGRSHFLHPNIINKPGAGWVHYCKKDKEYITNVQSTPYAVALACPTANEAIEHLWTSVPTEMCKHAKQIEENVRKRMRIEPKARLYFGPYPEHYHDFECDFKTHALLLWGPPGHNKTQFARYLLAHMFGDYFFNKKSVEGLKKRSGNTPFLFDEIYMIDRVSHEDSKEITDVENGGQIENCRYGALEIPPGVPRIFTSNYEFPFHNPMDAVYGRRVVSKYIAHR